MTKQPPEQPQPPSPIQNLFDAVSRIVDGTLNRVFALKHSAATLRSTLITVLFILAWLGMAVNTAGLPKIQKLMTDVLVAVISGDLIRILSSIWAALGSTVLHHVVLQHIIILVTPFLLINLGAAAYLADIFEKDRKIAEEFIRQAAFGGRYDTLHIREGKVIEADLESPIVAIGGPGKVVVELDSAVLFEYPDGNLHIIGPTNNAAGENILSAFERIRAIFDLRDITDSQTVHARTLDGIPVIARDVQYSYSIYRGPDPVDRTLKRPYPFEKNSIPNLAYANPRPVKENETPTYKPDWSSPLPGKAAGMVGGEISGFVSKRNLSQFLATIGSPELVKNNVQEAEINAETQRLSGGRPPGGSPIPGPSITPGFITRTKMTDDFFNSFQSKKAVKGVTLNWLGVGTWEIPAEIIPEKHLEAWKLSRENFARGAPEELERIKEDARLQEHLRMIQAMPIGRVNINEDITFSNDLIDQLLREYLERLKCAQELYASSGAPMPDLDNAIDIISGLLS